jgi:hypothetical protein
MSALACAKIHSDIKQKTGFQGRFRFWLPSGAPDYNGLATKKRCWFSASHLENDPIVNDGTITTIKLKLILLFIP